MFPSAAKMVEDVSVGAAGVFQGVGEDGQALIDEEARGKLPLFVDARGQACDGGGEPGAVEGDGAEGVASHSPGSRSAPWGGEGKKRSSRLGPQLQPALLAETPGILVDLQKWCRLRGGASAE